MRIQIDSKHSDIKSLDALREFVSNPAGKELRIKSTIVEMCSMNYDQYSTRPEINIDFHGTVECFPCPSNGLVSQIVSLFEKVSDARDLEFLKRYFEIKLK